MDTSPAHSSVGGSTVARLLGCAASLATIAKVPEAIRKESSAYAEEGAALHEVVARLLADPALTPESFIGATIQGRTDVTVTADLVRDCVLPILDFYNTELVDIDEYWLETRSFLPGVDDAFGTADFFGVGAKRTVLVDWKMGAGVGVSATYPDFDDPDVETVNPQLLFYLCGLGAAFPESLADGRTVDAYIVQPRHQDPDKRVTVARDITCDELDAFIAKVKAAVAEALGPVPRRRRGDWCRFARCKAICPEFTGPLLDLARLPSPAAQPLGHAHVESYARTLATGLALAEIVEPLIREYRAQAHQLLETGTPIEGWKLVPKRAVRRWIDDTKAAEALLAAGLDPKQIYAPAVTISVAQAEKVAKAADLAIPTDLIVKASSGTTLARDDDARIAVPDRDEAARRLARAMKGLGGLPK